MIFLFYGPPLDMVQPGSGYMQNELTRMGRVCSWADAFDPDEPRNKEPGSEEEIE
jgi:hypothetical protein